MPRRSNILKFPNNLKLKRIVQIDSISVVNTDDSLNAYYSCDDDFSSCPHVRFAKLAAITTKKIDGDFEFVPEDGVDDSAWWYIISASNTYIEFNNGYHIWIREAYYDRDIKILLKYLKIQNIVNSYNEPIPEIVFNTIEVDE